MKKHTFIKISALALTAGAFFTFQSCSKLAEALHFDVPMEVGTQDVTINPVDTSGTMAISSVNSINVDSIIKAGTQGKLGIKNISSVKITEVKITLNNATTASNFANFQSCTASLTSSANSTPYALTVSCADAYTTELSLPVDASKDLKSYMGNDAGVVTFTSNVTGTLRRKTVDTLKATIKYKYNISVNG